MALGNESEEKEILLPFIAEYNENELNDSDCNLIEIHRITNKSRRHTIKLKQLNKSRYDHFNLS